MPDPVMPAPAPAPVPPAAQPPSPTPQPTPQPAPAPAAPAAASPSPSETVLSPDQVIEITNPDGTPNYVQMRQLIDTYRNRPEIEAGEVEDLRTVRDALKGKPEAVQKLMQSFQGQPAGQPGAPNPASPQPGDTAEMAAMRQEIAAMQAALREATGVTSQITGLQERNGIKAIIKTYSQYVPYLSRIEDQAADMVRGEYHRGLQMAANGQHPAFPGVRLTPQNMLQQHRDKILGTAMSAMEQQVAGLVGAYGVQLQNPAAQPAAPAQQPTLVDDQQPPADMRQAPVRLVNGQFVRTATGTQVGQNVLGHLADIPADVPTPAAHGTAVPVTPANNPRMAFDLDGLQARMNQRLQQVNAARQ